MNTHDAVKVADAVTHAMMVHDRASHAAGIRIVTARPGEATVEMTVTQNQVNGHHVCHGGVLFQLADTAFALCCNSHGPQSVAAACDIVFVRPARIGDHLVARSVERVLSGRSGVYDVTVTRGEDVIAEFRGRSRTIAPTQAGSDGVRITED